MIKSDTSKHTLLFSLSFFRTLLRRRRGKLRGNLLKGAQGAGRACMLQANLTVLTTAAPNPCKTFRPYVEYFDDLDEDSLKYSVRQ